MAVSKLAAASQCLIVAYFSAGLFQVFLPLHAAVHIMFASQFDHSQANSLVKLWMKALGLHTQQGHARSRRLPDTGLTLRRPSVSVLSKLCRQTWKGMRPPTRSSTSSAAVQRRFLHSTRQVARNFRPLHHVIWPLCGRKHVQEPTAWCPHDQSAAEHYLGRQALRCALWWCADPASCYVAGKPSPLWSTPVTMPQRLRAADGLIQAAHPSRDDATTPGTGIEDSGAMLGKLASLRTTSSAAASPATDPSVIAARMVTDAAALPEPGEQGSWSWAS